MQFLVMKDASRIDAMLDPKNIEEQVIAKWGGPHGVLDLLAVTRTKRLAIIEWKAMENRQLPLQAALLEANS
jgi:hypothetical protein